MGINRSDRTIAALAAGQHGHVTRQQLLAHGFSRQEILGRLRCGRLIAVHQGVYAVGYLSPDPLGRAAAAVLACGLDALLSHFSAGKLWRMVGWWARQLDVTAPCERRRPGIRTHRSATLARADRTVHYGIPVTSPARTLHDLTPRLTNARLVRALNEAKHARYLGDDDLAELLDRVRNPRLAAIVTPGEEPTRSALEDAFVGLTRRYGLPRPRTNALVCGLRVDAWFEAQRVIVEIDSWEFHRDREQFELDRERDARTLQAGIRTLRVTSERMKRTPEREADRLRAILAHEPPALRKVA